MAGIEGPGPGLPGPPGGIEPGGADGPADPARRPDGPDRSRDGPAPAPDQAPDAPGRGTRRGPAERSARTGRTDLPEPGAEPLPGEAPDGTDPELWSLLSEEERSYFARARTLGPLTYGPDSSAEPERSVERGAHLDLRA